MRNRINPEVVMTKTRIGPGITFGINESGIQPFKVAARVRIPSGAPENRLKTLYLQGFWCGRESPSMTPSDRHLPLLRARYMPAVCPRAFPGWSKSTLAGFERRPANHLEDDALR
jgi:hypothetical protein